ncbi:MAG: YigZ family protein [Clostridia bacterium]|nr:YigZ family protein [Clostridia bacterium]
MADSYLTIEKEASDEFTEKRSRFIGYIKPVSTEAEALEFIEGIKKKHWDAKHNVYAYALKSGASRFSDDGEPQGTAGMPVLDVLQKSNVVDCVIVVTRYFGGILLGGGGLVRAYSHAASIAVAAAGIKEMKSYTLLTTTVDYNLYGKLENVVNSNSGSIEGSDFKENVTVSFLIPNENVGKFEKDLSEISLGSATCKIIEESIYR